VAQPANPNLAATTSNASQVPVTDSASTSTKGHVCGVCAGVLFRSRTKAQISARLAILGSALPPQRVLEVSKACESLEVLKAVPSCSALVNVTEPCMQSRRQHQSTMFLLIAIAVLMLTGTTPARGRGIEWETLNDEVMSLYAAGKHDRAVVVATKALAVAEKEMGADLPSVATDLTNLANLYEARGQYAAAEPLFARSLAIREKAFGKDHPDVVSNLENMADLYRKMDRAKDAEPLEERAKAIRAINC